MTASARLTGKTALITGAASGIGKTTGELFAREGARVILLDVNGDGANAAAEEIRSSGGDADGAQLDVTDPRAVTAMMADLFDREDRLEIAVNNAGVRGTQTPVEDISIEDWDRIITTNLSAVFLAMREQLRHMKASKVGSIVNLASCLGLVGRSGASAYSAAKHGVIGLTKCAALESARFGVRVNAVAPGFIDTPLMQSISPDPLAAAALADQQPAGRYGTTEEVAASILFLASDEASYVNGACLSVDSGYSSQ